MENCLTISYAKAWNVQIFCWNTKSFIDPISQLTNCLIRIGDYNNLAWVDVLSLYQILHFCSHRRSLSRTGASHQRQ